VFDPLIKGYSDGLESSSLKLRLLLQPQHFKNGILKVKCVSLVLEVFQITHETNVDVLDKDFKTGDFEDASVGFSEEPGGKKPRKKKKNRNQQDNKKTTPVSGVPENMSQGKS